MRHAGETVQAPTFPHEDTMIHPGALDALREPLRGLTWRYFLPDESDGNCFRWIGGIQYEGKVGYLMQHIHYAILLPATNTIVCTVRIDNSLVPIRYFLRNLILPKGGVPLHYYSTGSDIYDKQLIGD